MITLTPAGADDLALLARWLADPATNRWLTSEWRHGAANPTILAVALRNRRNRLFIVRNSGEPCGLVGLGDIDVADGTAMAWYLLGDRRLSGQGVITTAVRLLLDRAFGEMGLRSVYAWAMEGNTPSLRVLTKTGFRAAGRLRQSARLDERQVDRVYFDLTAAEWAATAGDTARAVAASTSTVSTSV